VSAAGLLAASDRAWSYTRPDPAAIMTTYSLEELLNRWARGELTPEQALGHILQHLLRIERESRQLKDLLLLVAEALKGQTP
jgi:hypothetical protein